MENKKRKNINITIFGKLLDINKIKNGLSIKLEGFNDFTMFCFLNSKEDYTSLIGKDVMCLGSMTKRRLTDETSNLTYGYESIFNIFKIKERPKTSSSRVVKPTINKSISTPSEILESEIEE